MKRTMKTMTGTLALGAVLATSPVLAAAETPARDDDGARLAEGLGVGSGAVAGLLVGGPIGMMVGAGLGTWLGGRVHEAGRLDETAEALAQTRTELERADQARAAAETRVAALSTTLAGREQEVVRLGRLAQEAASANAELREALATGVELQVMFRTGSSELTADSVDRLRSLADALAGVDGLAVRLDGYADPRGAEDFNESLAAERVASVQQALLAGGLTREQLAGFAHGERVSAAQEGDLDAYALERRVDVTLIAGEVGAVDEADLAARTAP